MAAKSSQWRPGPTVCRCCLAEGCYKDISTEYFWMGKREVYSDMLSDTFDVSISFSQSGGPNSNSRLICEPCISRLRDATEFKRQVQECEKTFMQHLSGGGLAEIELDPVQKVKIESIKEEKLLSDDDVGLDDDDDLFLEKTDFGDDDDDDDLDDEPLTRLATKVPKKEKDSELLNILQQTKSKLAEKRKSTTKTKATPTKKAKSTKTTAKASASQSSKKGECEEDDATWKNSFELIKKTSVCPFTVGPQNTVRCYYCLKTFIEPATFRTHLLSDHSNDRAEPTAYRRKIIRVDVTMLTCQVCTVKFEDLDQIFKHLNDEHDAQMATSANHSLVPLKLERDKYICLVCGRKFTGLKELSKHTGTHFLRHICETCGKNFETPRGLLQHVEVKHTIPSGQHYCKACKNHFESADDKKKHVRESNKCMPFRCSVCEQRFLFWERREQHLVEVHGRPKKMFPCSECEKVFEKRTLYYFHFKAAHTEELKCSHCSQTFSTKRSLTEHSYLHSGERPYKCHQCDKSFNRQKTLTQHLVLHDDSLKQACRECPRLFGNKFKLKDHMKRHHPDKIVENL